MYYCDTCPRAFETQIGAQQHMGDLGHWGPHVACETCPLLFKTQDAAERHMEEFRHWRHLCLICGEHFASGLFLDMHNKSNVHRPQHHECPYCFEGFATPSAVIHHLESTCCTEATDMNIASLHELISRLDPFNLLTIPGSKAEIKQEKPVILFHGQRFACHRCDRTFVRQAGLEAHLASPIHQEPIYHCLNRPESCEKKFVSLAAMWNHIESESCGVMYFEDLEYVHNQLKRATLGKHIITHADLAV